jgi:hypothetical protein
MLDKDKFASKDIDVYHLSPQEFSYSTLSEYYLASKQIFRTSFSPTHSSPSRQETRILSVKITAVRTMNGQMLIRLAKNEWCASASMNVVSLLFAI